MDLNALFSHLSQTHFGFNLLDVLIIVIVLFYAHEGFSLGFTTAMMDLLSFVASFTIALKFYTIPAKVFVTYLSMPLGFANAFGFFLLAFLCEVMFSLILRKLVHLLPSLPAAHPAARFFRKVNHYLGIIPGMISAGIVLSFLLTVIVSLPSSPLIKGLVTGSNLGSKLVANTALAEKSLDQVFGGAFNETLNFMTVEPQSNELVQLHYKVAHGTVDDEAEQAMFRAVNTERAKSGLHLLSFDNQLRDVARLHSMDMFERGYFSHYTPDGLSPFDRMSNAGIQFTYAGENLALAPSTDLAMQGLMNSPGHRANILNPNFNKIGVGVIDGGIYGKMYSQEFTD